MDAHRDRPSELPCGHCGASVSISWACVEGDLFRGVGRCSSCCWFKESYQCDSGLSPTIAMVLMLLGSGAGAGAGAGRACELASNPDLASAGFRRHRLD